MKLRVSAGHPRRSNGSANPRANESTPFPLVSPNKRNGSGVSEVYARPRVDLLLPLLPLGKTVLTRAHACAPACKNTGRQWEQSAALPFGSHCSSAPAPSAGGIVTTTAEIKVKAGNFVTVKVTRAQRSSGGYGGGQGGQGSSGGGRQEDPWASDTGGYSDEPPF